MNIKERAYQIASVNMKNKCSPAELEDFAEALVAELAKENKPVDVWQPIETAPKDGTVIMVAEETEPGFWEYEQGFYSHTWGFGGGSCTNNPTHWMPLPAAPKEK